MIHNRTEKVIVYREWYKPWKKVLQNGTVLAVKWSSRPLPSSHTESGSDDQFEVVDDRRGKGSSLAGFPLVLVLLFLLYLYLFIFLSFLLFLLSFFSFSSSFSIITYKTIVNGWSSISSFLSFLNYATHLLLV